MCALRFLDSFDHYTTGTQKWTMFGGNSFIVPGAARTGSRGVQIGGGPVPQLVLTLDAQGTWIVGTAFRITAAPAAGIIIQTSEPGGLQGAVYLNADGTFSLARAGVIVATSVRSILQNVFYYLEFKHIINNVAGTLELRVNEEVWVTFAGNTQGTGIATANQIGLHSVTNNGHFDDVYILDGTGVAPNNNYWGDTHIEALVPNAAGFYAQFLTLVGAATHWQANAEIPPDEDVSYVADAVLNNKDSYNMGNLSVASATINGIQAIMRARKTDAGAASIARLLRIAGLDYQGADVALGVSYAYILEQIALNPNTGLAWTVADVNGLEAGAVVR